MLSLEGKVGLHRKSCKPCSAVRCQEWQFPDGRQFTMVQSNQRGSLLGLS